MESRSSLSALSMIACAVLAVREVRATWRAQVDRVEHL
jgi:hypothetical protein